MKSMFLKLIAASLVIGAPLAIAGVALWPANTGLAPESMRKELSNAIVSQWAEEGANASNSLSPEWKHRMAPVLAKTDISNLEQAASASDYSSMTLALMGKKAGSSPDEFKVATGQRNSSASPKLGAPGSDLVYTPISPCRIVDTRLVGGPIAANSTRSFESYNANGFAGQGGDASNCNLPENVSAVTVKVASTRPVGDGFLTVYPFNETRPLASSLNYISGVDTSNESHFKLCRPACPFQFSVYSFRQSDIVIDVNGYFMEPEAAELDCTVAQQTGNLDLLGGLQPRSASCPAGYTATGGGCGGPLGIGVNNSMPMVTNGKPTGWQCDLVGSLLSVVSYQVSATCCRTPGR